LSDFEKILEFELTESMCSTDEDTPEGCEDVYYYIEAFDENNEVVRVTIFLTFDAEFEDEVIENEQAIKMPVNPNKWEIITARMTFDID